MADNKTTESALILQVANLAPTINNLLNSRTARLRASLTSHDVTSGYGHGFTVHLFLDLMIEQCRTCGETPWSAPVLECKYHRFDREFMQIADTEAPTLERALVKLDKLAELRLGLRRAA